MLYKSKYLKGSYRTKRELFRALKANERSIFSLKKAGFKDTDAIGWQLRASGDVSKAADLTGIDIGDTIYPVINSCNILDSHEDVHIPGIWNKSVQEQQGRVFYTADHQITVNNVIAHPEHVELFLKDTRWRDLGLDVDGSTECLIFGVQLTEGANPRFVSQLKAGNNFQQSIRMRYVRLAMCINDSSNEFKEAKARWDMYFPAVINKNDALELGYFFAILEAKIEKEGSAVPFGSNHATTVLRDLQNTSPLKSTNITEPLKRTRLLEAKRLLTLN